MAKFGFTRIGTDASETLDDLTSYGGFRLDDGGNDTIYGLAGNDVIAIHNGDDTVFGGNGIDTISDLGGGNDTMYGEAGADTFFTGTGVNLIDGGTGIDTIDYSGSTTFALVNLQSGMGWSSGLDTLVSIENVFGSSYGDAIQGDAGSNVLNGWNGDDRLEGGAGADVLVGGAGFDTAVYAGSSAGVIANLSNVANSGGDAQGDLLQGIEGLSGSAFSDSLVGNAQDNVLDGNDGADSLSGLLGADILRGGAGTDTLFGGLGDDTLYGGTEADRLIGEQGDDVMSGGEDADTFVFQSWSDIAGLDVITDFVHGVDKIDLSWIDARPAVAGSQAFTFDSTPDGDTEEFFDGLSDDWGGLITNEPGPVINGDTGEIEFRHGSDGNTYVYVSYGDGMTDASICLNGIVNLTASDFIL